MRRRWKARLLCRASRLRARTTSSPRTLASTTKRSPALPFAALLATLLWSSCLRKKDGDAIQAGPGGVLVLPARCAVRPQRTTFQPHLPTPARTDQLILGPTLTRVETLILQGRPSGCQRPLALLPTHWCLPGPSSHCLACFLPFTLSFDACDRRTAKESLARLAFDCRFATFASLVLSRSSTPCAQRSRPQESFNSSVPLAPLSALSRLEESPTRSRPDGGLDQVASTQCVVQDSPLELPSLAHPSSITHKRIVTHLSSDLSEDTRTLESSRGPRLGSLGLQGTHRVTPAEGDGLTTRWTGRLLQRTPFLGMVRSF